MAHRKAKHLRTPHHAAAKPKHPRAGHLRTHPAHPAKQRAGHLRTHTLVIHGKIHHAGHKG